MPASDEGRTAAPHGLLATVLLAVAHAAAFAGAFPPVGLWPAVLVAPALLTWLALGAASTRRAVAVVVLVQWAMWLGLQRWLVPVSAPGYPILALYLAGYGGVFAWLVRRAARHPRLGRLPLVLVVPVAWVGLEALRGEFVLSGYPWFLLAHPLVEWPGLAQAADLLGAYFVSSLVALAAGGLVDVLRPGRRPAARIAIGTVVLVVLGANAAYGAWRLAGAGDRPGPTLLVIQTNLPQDNKIGWTLEAQRRDVAAFLGETRRAAEAATGAVDLVVWPETMLPGRGLERDTLRTLLEWNQIDALTFANDVVELSRELGIPMLVGSPSFDGLDVDEDRRWTWTAHYNSAYLIEGDLPRQRYDKVHLTPFGEVMPVISSWPWLEQQLISLGAHGMTFSLDAADAVQRIVVPWAGADLELGTPICFEVTVAPVCRRMVYEDGRKRAALLVNLSNDGWFGDHDAGRAQHAQIARYRCIENRVPMVRCANTGLSVAIDASGRVVGRIGEGRYGEPRRAGSLSASVALDDRTTLFSRLGDLWPWTCLVLVVALGIGSTLEPRRGKGRRKARRHEGTKARRGGEEGTEAPR